MRNHTFVCVLLVAILLLGCTFFQDEVDKKISECEKNTNMALYLACGLSVVKETAKTNPERAKKACERIRDDLKQSTKLQVTGGSDFYSVQSEFAANSFYDTCLYYAIPKPAS